MPAAILDVDLERSWLDALVEGLDAELAIDQPGLIFRAKGRDRWVEPRLVSFSPVEANLRVPWEDVGLQVRCFVKVEAKGERQLTLSEVVDEVRRVIDPRRRATNNPAGIIRIRNCDGGEVGILQCSPPSERRAYNQSAKIRGDQLEGLDVATLTVPCKLTSNVCG
jgi:hypothetical protein